MNNKKLTPKEKLVKDMFQMVYQWGRVGIVVDENCPSFQKDLKKLEKLIRKENHGRNHGSNI